MNESFELAENLVNHLAKETQTGEPHPASGYPLLTNELKRLESSLSAKLLELKKETQIRTFLNTSLQKLTRIADTLFHIHDSISPDTRAVLAIIDNLSSLLPQYINPQLHLPKAIVQRQGQRYEEQWKTIQSELSRMPIDPLLLEIAGLPISLFQNQNKPRSWHDLNWLNTYAEKLSHAETEFAECETINDALVSLLIRLGYNHQRFINYCLNLVKSRLGKSNHKAGRLLELNLCKKLILQDASKTSDKYDNRSGTVSDILCDWIDEQISFVERFEPEKSENYRNPYKLTHNMNIIGLAFWYKLQYDHGVFEQEENLDTFSEKIAGNCSTKQQADLSAMSIKSKLYTKDDQAIKQIGKLLTSMLEDVKRFGY